MAKSSILEDYFLQEYKKGNIAKANLTDVDFEDLVKQYNSGSINFTTYSNKFYKLALELIIKRVGVYPI